MTSDRTQKSTLHRIQANKFVVGLEVQMLNETIQEWLLL